MRITATVTAILALVLASGCSGESGGNGDHAWKEQADTIDRAKQAEQKIMQQAVEKRREIEELDQ